MRHVAFTVVIAVVLVCASHAFAAPQAPIIEGATSPAQEAGMGLAAACVNIAYAPVRLVVTLVTAEVGGLTGLLTGGDRPSAWAVWDSTDGQAFITPEILQGHERLRFGRQSTY